LILNASLTNSKPEELQSPNPKKTQQRLKDREGKRKLTKLAPTSDHTKNPLATIMNPLLNQICTTLLPRYTWPSLVMESRSRCSDSHSGSNNLKDESYSLAKEEFQSNTRAMGRAGWCA